jgi:hypothetical protein
MNKEQIIETMKKIHQYIDDKSHMDSDLALKWGCEASGVDYKWYCDNLSVWSKYQTQRYNEIHKPR